MKLVGYTVQSADDGIVRYIKFHKRRESAEKELEDVKEYLLGYKIVETEIVVIE